MCDGKGRGHDFFGAPVGGVIPWGSTKKALMFTHVSGVDLQVDPPPDKSRVFPVHPNFTFPH